MDVGSSGPGPVDRRLLTLQSVHRSRDVWDNREVISSFRAIFLHLYGCVANRSLQGLIFGALQLFQAPSDLRLRINYGEYWKKVRTHKPHQRIMDAIRDLGFDCIFRLGQLRHDRGLITAFIERWRGETHTFHLPFGEATVTLEDVHHILLCTHV
ncbi:hypothetical protein DCAR_0312159 [Daucus carota subsp. sativus]|uniref:Aminotransferase-like plant mobile domain-containing protein n=1 Tax=Daucus carota subsp. sativus TaxID=79200 RepID=A0AAF1ATV7_DAUCS|nr:hypothetical protein DCAR_0312159 [Daucus carota subsp. sativus]